MRNPPQKLAMFSLGAGYTTRSKAFGLFVVFGLIFVLIPASLQAAALTEAYSSQSDVQQGMVVSLSRDNPDQIEGANLNNQDYIVGVATSPG
jgi:hypothetical protein